MHSERWMTWQTKLIQYRNVSEAVDDCSGAYHACVAFVQTIAKAACLPIIPDRASENLLQRFWPASPPFTDSTFVQWVYEIYPLPLPKWSLLRSCVNAIHLIVLHPCYCIPVLLTGLLLEPAVGSRRLGLFGGSSQACVIVCRMFLG